MSYRLHSKPDPVVLALGDSFLKVRPRKEARCMTWDDEVSVLFEASGHLFGMEG